MDIINNLPAIVKITLVFILILLAIWRKVSLGHSLMAATVVLGFLFGIAPLLIVKSAFFSMIHPRTLSLAVIVMLILILSHSMETAGQMTRLLDTFKGLIHHSGINLVVFPALIGLLPMPGGAIFSAPMVKNLGERRHLTNAQLSYVNYWFRHIWEYWWPLYPGVLLTMTISELNLWYFIGIMLPITLVAMISGYWPIGFRVLNQGETIPGKRPHLFPFFIELSPIVMAIVLGIGLGALFSVIFKNTEFPIPKEAGLIVALVISILWIWRQNGLNFEKKWAILKRRQLLKMFYLVAAILVFKGILEDSLAIRAVSSELIQLGIPLVPITIILPFIVGCVGGIAIAFVGTTFPILVSLIHTYGETQLLMPYMILAMVSGFLGVLLSPLHLCLLLSNEYFKTSLISVYRHLWLPCSVLFLASGIYFWVIKWMIAGDF